jgi:archaemetzincin
VWWIGAGPAEAAALAEVRRHLAAVYGPPVRLRHPAARPQEAYDARRGQHSSTRILAWLAGQHREGPGKVLGLTDVDLFIPVLTFVFGEAQLGGRVAVVSTARLSGPGGAEAERLLPRLKKEAAHELGHTFGLLHCGQDSCVMSRSASLADVDAKGSLLCKDCHRHLVAGVQAGGVS